METPGLSNTSQAPVRAEQRQGAVSHSPVAQQAAETDVPRAVREVSRVAESGTTRKAEDAADEKTEAANTLPFDDDLFPPVFPEAIPADLSPAERSAAYAQLLGPEGGTDPNSAAQRLFLTARNLFSR